MRRGALAVSALVLAVVVLVGVGGVQGQATGNGLQASMAQDDYDGPALAKGYGGKTIEGREDDDQQAFPGNTTFTISTHEPGAKNATFSVYAKGYTEDIRMHYNKLEQPEFFWADCTSSQHAKVFGVDRGNDGKGTKTDMSLLTSYKSVTYYDDGVNVVFYKEDKLGGSPVKLSVDDEVVARVGPCVHTPDEPGWYRATGYINGSTKMDAQTDYTIYGASEYVYICEGCDSREDAREKLGPEPTTCPTNDRFGRDDKEWTCRTDDGTYYKHGEDPDGGAGTPTPTPEGGTPTPGDTTATPTPADDGTDSTPTATPTPTPADENPGASTPTATPTPAPQEDDSAGDGSDSTDGDGDSTGGDDDSTGDGSDSTGGGDGSTGSDPTATATAAQQTGNQAQTPTAGSGPGFGIAAAVAAVLALLALARRR